MCACSRSGFGANALGVATGNLYITVYERTRQALVKTGVEDDPATVNFLSGGAASFVSQSVVVPLDVLSQVRAWGNDGKNNNNNSMTHNNRSRR